MPLNAYSECRYAECRDINKLVRFILKNLFRRVKKEPLPINFANNFGIVVLKATTFYETVSLIKGKKSYYFGQVNIIA
jgi:hypothetical protein